MKKLSVIIPYVNEYPNIAFTVQNLVEELKGIDAEIITVANRSCQMNPKQPDVPDWGFYKLTCSPYVKQGILKNIKYDTKLSHWNAKNAGIDVAEGERLLFLDAHTIIEQGSIRNMLETPIEGTLNMQVCYMLDPHRLIYKTCESEMGYRFTYAPAGQTQPYRVPVMSTCGMMIEKKTLLDLGRWHKELGIYGGGENYMMYKLATCGYPIMIHPKATVFHYSGDFIGRGYSWNYTDYVRNQFIAAYCVGDEEWLQKLLEERKAKPHSNKARLDELANEVRQVCKEDREFIKSKQKCTMTEYFEKWRGWDKLHPPA
jgi:glycosyltransferase involved in cell wall biosynthesis